MTTVRFPDAQRTHPLPVEVPDNTGWTELDDAVRKYQELTDKKTSTYTDVERLRREHAAAEQADREALATAIRTDGKAPGTAAVDNAETKLRDAERLYAALEIAVNEQAKAITAVITEHQDRWTAEQRERLEAARTQYLAELDRLAVAHVDPHEQRARLSFVEKFPCKVKPPTDVAFQEQLAALRTEAESPKPISPTTFRTEVPA